MRLHLKPTKTVAITAVAGLLVGAIVVIAARMVAYDPHQVHYHANFALYINGQREQFKDPTYYQETAVCSSTNDITTLAQRSHMHDNENSVVHVHDHVVTWGDFFQGLGWYVGPDFIETRDGTMYREDAVNKLHVIVNGQDYTGLGQLPTMIIQDKSRVLISYGDIDAATIKQEYASVPKTAAKHDVEQDPAACSGSEKITFQDRLQHILN